MIDFLLLFILVMLCVPHLGLPSQPRINMVVAVVLLVLGILIMFFNGGASIDVDVNQP